MHSVLKGSIVHLYREKIELLYFTVTKNCVSTAGHDKLKKMFLYHCLSKSAMYKQEKRLIQITLLEQPHPIK